LTTQENSKAEIFLESKEDFYNTHGKEIEVLNEILGDRFVLNEKSFKGVIPHAVRFLYEPETKCDYVYISDVDIFFTEYNVLGSHRKAMEESGQSFSNIVRKNTCRLTGLHVTKWDSFYPIPSHEEIISEWKNDEQILYHLVKKKLGEEPRKDLVFRPVHGIHTSPNRKIANGINGQSWEIDKPKAINWVALTRNPEWRAISQHLGKVYLSIMSEIDLYIKRYGL